MTVGFGPSRPVLPASNLGQDHEVRRRLAQVVGRAAERTRVAVSVDAHHARLWLRNPRGTTPCPCTAGRLVSGGYGAGSARISIEPGEGDDLDAPDSGYPQGRVEAPDEQLPLNPPEGAVAPDDVASLLLGNGRRCGICWGTGWLDGHRLWGGERVVLCATSSAGATLHPDSTAEVDMDSPTPTMLGPESPLGSAYDTPLPTSAGSFDPTAAIGATGGELAWASWTLDLPEYVDVVDALRVRSGLGPAEGSWRLVAATASTPTPIDAAVAMGLSAGIPGCRLTRATRPTTITLYLGPGARVSHVELVLRSEPLVNVQFPQLQAAASTELVAPYLVEEFELDPSVGFVERGSLIEVPPVAGGVGYVWIVADVTVKKSAQGAIFGVVGTARSIQPTEIYACVSMDGALDTGLMDRGSPTRGLESTGSGLPVEDGGREALKRSAVVLDGGGSAPERRAVIVLSSGASPDE